MPLNFRIEIFKSAYGEEWANDYLTMLNNMNDAAQLAQRLVELETAIHTPAALIVRARVSSYVPGDRTHRILVYNQPGQRQVGGQTMPLFNTARVDLATLDQDNGRKYYRLPLSEDDQSAGLLQQGLIDAIDAAYNTFFTDPTYNQIFTASGNLVTGISVFPYVQMRQLHRKRRRSQ